MKHNILVKFKQDVDYLRLIDDIKNLFDGLLTIDGVNDVKLHRNCIDRDNRYHLLIQIDMKKETLPIYDESIVHQTWKSKYSEYIEAKAIFDYE